MFCGKCGKEAADGTEFCPNCGNRFSNEKKTDTTLSKKPDKNLVIKIAAGVVAAVVVIVGGILIFGSDKPEDVVLKYAEAFAAADYEKAMKYTAVDTKKFVKDYIKYTCEKDDISETELYEELDDALNNEDVDVPVKNLKDLYKNLKKTNKMEMEESYGEYEYIIEIADDLKDMTKKELKNEIELFENDFPDDLDFDDYIDTSKIKEACLVPLEIAIDGEDDSYSEETKFAVVKYKGKWKVLEPYLLSVLEDSLGGTNINKFVGTYEEDGSRYVNLITLNKDGTCIYGDYYCPDEYTGNWHVSDNTLYLNLYDDLGAHYKVWADIEDFEDDFTLEANNNYWDGEYFRKID